METLICEAKKYFALFVSNSLHYYVSSNPYLELLSCLESRKLPDLIHTAHWCPIFCQHYQQPSCQTLSASGALVVVDLLYPVPGLASWNGWLG